MKKNLKNFILAAGVLLAALVSVTRLFDLYELQTYDWRFKFRGARPISEKIVFIDIWDDTLTTLGAWPIDRINHAYLIQALAMAGAKAVTFDILFSEPKPGDEEVAESAREAGNVYFVYAFDEPKVDHGSFSSKILRTPLLEPYLQSAKAAGFINIKADMDGKRRRAIPFIDYRGKRHYQLGLKMAMDVLGIKEEGVSVLPEKEIRFSNGLRIPLDDEGYFIVNYAGTWERSFKHYSYLDVIAAYTQTLLGEKPRVDLTTFKDKICFVGLTSMGSHDVNPTPVQSVYPMVGSHANVLNSILERDFIRRLSRGWNLLILLGCGLWIAAVSSGSKLFRALLYTVLTVSVFTLLAVLLFARWGIWIDLFYPLVLFIVIYLATTLTRAIFERRKRELIEGELKIASQIQQSFLPQSLPEQKGIGFFVFMKPATAVGGDLYALLPFGEGRMGVMVGDVSGKGTPAALFMAKTVSEFKFSARDRTDPSKTLEFLNDSIASESTGGLFVTMAYALFDLNTRKMILSNGGHLPVVALNKEGSARLLTAEGGMPIGVMPQVPFSNLEIDLHEGDCFAFYSDGVSEARNRKKEEFGIEALAQSISRNLGLPAQEILDRSVQALNQFMGKADQHDDITLIIVKIEPVS